MTTKNPCNGKCEIAVGSHACRDCGLFDYERQFWNEFDNQQKEDINAERIHRRPPFDINAKVEIKEGEISMIFGE